MTSGLLLLRLVLGIIIAAHGAQKLFGWFGGGGLKGTAGFMQSLGMRAPSLMALIAGMSEFGGGVLFAAGLLTPLAALAIAVVMFTAIWTVHVKHGLFASNGGYEMNLLLIAGAVAVSAIGPGKWSLDHAFDLTNNSWWMGWQTGLVVGVAALVISGLNVTVGRKKQAPSLSE